MQILTHNLRGPAKMTCYLRKSVAGEENAFHSIQGRAFYPLLVDFFENDFTELEFLLQDDSSLQQNLDMTLLLIQDQ